MKTFLWSHLTGDPLYSLLFERYDLDWKSGGPVLGSRLDLEKTWLTTTLGLVGGQAATASACHSEGLDPLATGLHSLANFE